MEIYKGRWHGRRFYYGLHHDLHANKKDTELGLRCSPRHLVPMLRLAGPDFAQTDCKGHPGYTSWFSRTPAASVPPGLKKDALAQWRRATRTLGMPLHCHYSGIWDAAAGAKHPEWGVVNAQGKPAGAPFGQNAGTPTNEKMCPRGPYLDELMIPQLLELIDRYDVDGFWIDGDIWAVEPCYCARCRRAFTEATGIAEPPADVSHPDWPAWWNFMLESFEQYVTRYCDAVHRHKEGVLVCSNWLQTFRHPGAPTVPTDWISGDNAWVWGLDGSRCEARFLSTRGKPWDIMLWNFYCSHGMGDPSSPWTRKPVEMVMQEAAVLLSFGGNVQVYQGSLRDGRMEPWVMKRIGQVGRFVKRRRALCQGAETIPQVAVLHSEHHARSRPTGKNLMWNVDTAPVEGAVFSLLENGLGVDILDEWALLPRLAEFPVVVAPEQHRMSGQMAGALVEYVRRGGRLLVTGAESFERFGAAFLGVGAGRVQEKGSFMVPAQDGAVPLWSEPWRLVRPARARCLAPLVDAVLRPRREAAAVLHAVGRGRVAYVPASVFRDFQHNRYPMTRAFIGRVVRALAGRLDVEVTAPVCIDAALRRKGDRRIVHLVSRASGIPNRPNSGAIDQVPPVGPVTIVMRAPRRPRSVTLAFERAHVQWTHVRGRLRVSVPQVRVHAAVVVR